MQTITLLLIEPDPGKSQFVLARLAESTNFRFETHCVDSLAAGLNRLAAGRIELALLDAILLGARGSRTLLHLRERYPACPVIVLNPVDDDALAGQCLQEGAQDFISKDRMGGEDIAHAICYAIERKRTESAVFNDYKVIRALIDGLPDHIYAKDLESRFVFANEATRRFFGLKNAANMFGKTDRDLFPIDAATYFLSEEKEIIRSGHPLLNRESCITDASGTQRWVLSTKTCLCDSDGKIIGIAGINRDISELKRTLQDLHVANASLARRQDELVNAMNDLQQVNHELAATQLRLCQAEKMEVLGRLAAGVAHEVKNPLAIINVGVDYLLQGPMGREESLALALQRMRAAVVRADSVVRGMLDFAVPRPLDARPANLNDVVRQAATLVKHELMFNHIKLTTELSPNLPELRIDVPKIEQVLVNLMINAIQAMENTGGVLCVRTRAYQCGNPECDAGNLKAISLKPGDRVIAAEVDDTGPGIAEDILPKIFDPFFTTKQPGKGSGLGLAVARSIMQLHGGILEISNRPEGGAKAEIIFNADHAPFSTGKA